MSHYNKTHSGSNNQILRVLDPNYLKKKKKTGFLKYADHGLGFSFKMHKTRLLFLYFFFPPFFLFLPAILPSSLSFFFQFRKPTLIDAVSVSSFTADIARVKDAFSFGRITWGALTLKGCSWEVLFGCL